MANSTGNSTSTEEYILYVPSGVLAVLVLLGLCFLCMVYCCCIKASTSKNKIYEMMEEAKLDINKEDLVEEESEDEDEGDESTIAQTQ